MLIFSLDIGSVATKALIWSKGDGAVKAFCQTPSAWQPLAAAAEALEKLNLKAPGLQPEVLAATGYGRNLLAENCLKDFAGAKVKEFFQFNEITALARGVNRVCPEARLILDVGGQDSKALSIDEKGGIIDFVLNDKCAAGAGAFIDNICRSFNLNHEEFGALAAGGRPAALSSMCAVFAQTELVAQIAKGVSRADLAAGILASLAGRLKTQCGRLFGASQVVLTGGLSRLPSFVDLLSAAMGAKVAVPPQAPFLAAIGAAIMAGEKIN